MYFLYGSYTSPFVRRMRMVMHSLPFEFKEMNIYTPEGNAELEKINPIKQIPVLKDGSTVIWDSRHIYRYLQEKHHWPKLSWDEENRLTAIERGLDGGIASFLLGRSGIPMDQPLMYKDRQLDRMHTVLMYLEPWIKTEALKTWNFQTMTLYAWLDWANFRGVLKIEKYPFCEQFLKVHATRAEVTATRIPEA
jgi:glutathione S-transferase